MEDKIEQINVEEIMSEIREQIKERGYTEKELKFADLRDDLMPGSNDFYSYEQFAATVDQMDNKRVVQWWNPITGNPVSIFFKRFIRKCVTFIIDPIVVRQNDFNNYTASAFTQIGAKFEQEQDYDLEEMQNKIELLEQRIAELEKKCGE